MAETVAQILDRYSARILQRSFTGDHAVLDRDILIHGGLRSREAAQELEISYARVLTRLELGRRYGVFVRHIGGGAGWGVYCGPQASAQQKARKRYTPRRKAPTR